METLEPCAELGARVVAAAKSWMRTSECVRSERALFALQGCFPGYDEESALLKVVALQALDSGRVMAVPRWAAHVARVMKRVDPRDVGLELVDALANVPGATANERKRALTIASRFAHYFVDADRFPVLDRWTRAELDRVAPPSVGASRYVEFAARHTRLAAELGIARPRFLAWYLWVAGQWRAWRRNARTPIHRSARAMFERGTIAALELDPSSKCAAA
jgi:hypothetical protein